MSDMPPQPPYDPYGSQPPTPPPPGGGYGPPGGGYGPPPGGGYGAPPPPPPGGGYGPPPGSYPPGGNPPGGGYGSPAGAASQWGTLAEWAPRALGLLIDSGILLAAVIALFIVGTVLGAISSTLGAIVFVLGYVAIVGASIWFSVQVGQSGASPGMRIIGLRCISKATGQPIGGGMGFVRQLAHFVDGLICYIGWLFPLWDAEKQTLADKIIGTVVVTVPKQGFSLTPTAA